MTKNVFLPLFNIDYLLIFWFKILAHCAMLQCMSWYNKPPWVALTTTASLTITIKLGAIKYFFVNNTKIFVTSSVLKLQKWFLHQNGVELNQKSKSDDSGPLYKVTERCKAVPELPKVLLKMASGLISPSGHRRQLCIALVYIQYKNVCES